MRAQASIPHCLVTGSASGIGLALTRRLLRTGWRVYGVDRQLPPDLSDPADEGHVTDLEDETATAALAGRLRDRGLTAIVHCAGLTRTGGTADTRSDDADRLWKVHAVAPMALLRELAAELPDRRGRIVLVSSRAVLGRVLSH